VSSQGDLVDCNPPVRSVLPYGSGPSPDFLAKILGVDLQQFLSNTQLYVPVSSL
jgi:hypothetical protein